MKRVVILVFATLIALSCKNREELISAFTLDDTVRLEVNGIDDFAYNAAHCQTAISTDGTVLIATTDDGADFFKAVLKAAPIRTGQEIGADIRWTAKKSMNEKKNVALTVKKIEGDKFWLWSDKLRLGIVFSNMTER